MARIVRLTESDLTRLVKRVIQESKKIGSFDDEMGWFDEDNMPVKPEDFGDDYEEEEYDEFEPMHVKHGKDTKWFANEPFGASYGGKDLFNKYREHTGKPMRIRTRRSMDEQPEDIDSEDYSSYSEKTFQKITNASKREVDIFLENLPENTKFIQISDCEYADFSSIDICSFPKLVFMSLKGTKNNFEEQNYDCPFLKSGNGVYDFTPDY